MIISIDSSLGHLAGAFLFCKNPTTSLINPGPMDTTLKEFENIFKTPAR